MSVRLVSVVVLGAVLTAGLAACAGQGAETPTAAPTTAATTTTATTPPASKPATEPSAKPVKRRTTPAMMDACPVSEAALLKVMKDKRGTLRKGTTITKIKCFQRFAISVRQSPGADGEVEVYRYAAGTWTYFVGGSAEYCVGVPADVTKHFRTVGYEGCKSTSGS